MVMVWTRAEITFCVACAPCANRGTCDWRFQLLFVERDTASRIAVRRPSLARARLFWTQEPTRAPAV